jgi:excisionase family DNA binding protein
MAENNDGHEADKTSRSLGHRRRNRDDHITFWTIADVADRLQVASRTVRRWIDNRELVAHRIGGIVRIAESDLRAFLAQYREG